jgi:hypothetical protein
MDLRNLLLIAIVLSFQAGYSQAYSSGEDSPSNPEPIVSGIHTLSIHVKDTISQDSVTLFLQNSLGLPVYYTPVNIGIRRYSGLYAGNMVLEPCGPYPNIKYASDDFRSIFYGLNFEVYKSLESSERALQTLGVEHQVNQGSIYIRDSILSNQSVFAALYEVTDAKIRDSLKQKLWSEGGNYPGIEYIKEIVIGYKQEINYLRWKEFLHPKEVDNQGKCPLNDSLTLQLVRADINQVKSITFKVKSLDQANQYLRQQKLYNASSEGCTSLDRSQTYGLLIYMNEEK